jgi:hypothetical protein
MVMEGISKGSKLSRQEGEGIVVKKQNVFMGMDVLDCPGCSNSKPLRHPIFQVMDCDWCFLPDYSH